MGGKIFKISYHGLLILNVQVFIMSYSNGSALKGHFIKAQGSALGTEGFHLGRCLYSNDSALKGRFIKAQGSALGTQP
ncbi:MAG: hypothetical protein DRR19_15535 [Candidatus Parabeggiatoa sp. nov. 1]|nr:MAG: hypothetical protein DRR19_15535 [Gammaproteobacteria bacterium]